MPKIIALIPAAGVGSRMMASCPKQYLPLTEGRSETVLERTVSLFCSHPAIDAVYVAVSDQDQLISHCDLGRAGVLRTGGETRAETVLNTLNALAGTHCDYVLIHDAARPLVSAEDVTTLIRTGMEVIKERTAAGTVLAMPVSDTVKRVNDQGDIIGDVDRNGLWRMATPQFFQFDELLHILDSNRGHTDESSAVRAAGKPVRVVRCSPTNIKLTTPEDRDFVSAFLKKDQRMAIRVGIGFDSHRLVKGRPLIIGGVEIEHCMGLDGHSDADVLLHAIIDALLGAAGLGNIGLMFPDTDMSYKGADSKVLLQRACERVDEAGWTIGNIDCVLVAEKPKLNPHLQSMRETIARVLNIELSQISIKPKTNEKLGFEGRQEGISAQVVALIEHR